MKVVKINKHYRNATREYFLVLLINEDLPEPLLPFIDEPYSNEDTNSFVEEWCERDPSGMNYGYTYEWCFVEDKEVINNVLKDKIKIINSQIETLKTKKCEIERYLK